MSRHSTTAITTLNKTSGVTPCRGCERGGRRGAQAGRGVCWRGGRVRDQLGGRRPRPVPGAGPGSRASHS
ncbi:hypothetical protein E2C01_045283 [Portunus trituberculatus]|uniref:Uncharacterized protein n=1 Tax=Portunus trituberculatus TaxID=210409 RepID=A0A5B7G2R7_PORTR|nr:hypothetical protein [Portunus trituberculatus]